jgi:hypothetical protein
LRRISEGRASVLLLAAPIVLIISILAIRDIRKNPQRRGMSRAIFGLVLGSIGTILLTIMIISIESH